jgi:para-aminobenzoate synthetase component 1
MSRRRDNPIGAPLAIQLRNSDPLSALARLSGSARLLLLDSARPDPRLGRYSFFSTDPYAWLTARGRTAHLDWRRQDITPPIAAGTHHDADPFALLRSLLAPCVGVPLGGLPPFQGGAAGLFGYDLAHHIERLPRPRFDEFQVPDLAVGLYDWVLAQDHEQGKCWLISTGWPEPDPARRAELARRRADQVRGWLSVPPGPGRMLPQTLTVEPEQSFPLPGFPGVTSNRTRREFEEVIARGIEYVHAGDVFQVNLSQRLLAPLTLSPVEVYLRLRRRNPAPFAGFLDLNDFAIASASPERFLEVRGREVRTRPIKGTRPRGATPTEDAALQRDLLASVKDRAENVMIVDLLRNDLGRVCAYGSVRPTEVCKLETYEYVHHLVSEVVGTLRPECDRIDLLRAAFPGGSVTGAPKVRAMEIIAELEPTARGPYCGALGYLGFDGSMDTNLLIRTLTLGRGWMQFPVGGGIVADSDPAAEYDETLHKARGLLRVLDP